ncbi:MAG TPA: glycerol-3-phosphate 1-O-acyltransferase PlsY [Segeticoccus sp.]|nr:glycerol-3-phosphate 1-O-acyltransferase PlsY [Segeticoccus sp.]
MPATSGQWLLLAVLTVAAFLVGAVSPATMVARARKGDLRLGSGNPGATNAGRLLGVRYGVIVALLDVLKGLVPTLLTLLLVDRLTAYAVGLAAVLGHMFSPFLRWRGGKGVATALGAVLAVLPWHALGMLVVFAVVLAVRRWVALASLSAALALAVLAFVVPVPDPQLAARVWVVALAVLVAVRHRRNLVLWAAGRR